MPDATQSRFSERSVPQRPEGDAFSDGGVGGETRQTLPLCTDARLLSYSVADQVHLTYTLYGVYRAVLSCRALYLALPRAT